MKKIWLAFAFIAFTGSVYARQIISLHKTPLCGERLLLVKNDFKGRPTGNVPAATYSGVFLYQNERTVK